MRPDVALLGGLPIFDRPLEIVRPVFPEVETFIEPFKDALRSGRVTNNSVWVQEFERRLSEYLGVPTIVFCNGQLALMTMLGVADLKDREVIVPSFTFAATPHAVLMCGGVPVFAEILKDGSFCLDPEDVERRITERTVAIVGVDSYGVASDYEALTRIGRRHGLKVLFDSAPSFGTRVGGRPVGGFGDAQIFSFHATKAFATMEGGCLCSHDEGLLARARAVRNFGQVAGGDCVEPGINGKMSEICALIGLEQLKTFDEAVGVRRRAVARMQEGLRGLPGLTVGADPAGQEPVWLYLPVVVDGEGFGLDRDEVATAFESERLNVRKYYSPPCHRMTAYAGSASDGLAITDWAADNVLALPVYNNMTDAESDGIVQAFHEVHRSAAKIRKHLSAA